jgi:hypothetical protein
MDPAVWEFRGQSRIVDSAGTVLGHLGTEPGALVERAVISGPRRVYREPPSYGGWLQPGAAAVRKIFIPLDIVFGRLFYALCAERRRTAGLRFLQGF